MNQSDITGLTDRQVRRLEEGNTVPHIDTLKKLAVAHEMSIDDYLKELAKRARHGTGRHARHRKTRAQAESKLLPKPKVAPSVPAPR